MSKSKSWELSRRSVLRGAAGAVLSLPWLEAMAPSVARAQATGSKPPLRFVGIFHSAGVIPNQWFPTTEGTSYALPASLSPLEPVKNDVLVLSGLRLGSWDYYERTHEGATLRQITEAHRANPSCSGCHDVLDPIDFGLENYDAAGAWREVDNGSPVDSAGNFQGASFQGPRELASILKQDPAFSACISRQALAYGLGRELTAADDAVLRGVDARFAQGGHRLPELMAAVALSDSFRHRCPRKTEVSSRASASSVHRRGASC